MSHAYGRFLKLPASETSRDTSQDCATKRNLEATGETVKRRRGEATRDVALRRDVVSSGW